jgi:hypothetical protein
MLKKILAAALLLSVIGAGVAYYLWNKPHEDIAGASPAYTVEAAALFAEFEANEQAANEKYLGKLIAVTGPVRESTTADDGSIRVVLETGAMFGVSCGLDPLSTHARKEFPAGETLTIKGNCTGFNLDVQLERCVEVQ